MPYYNDYRIGLNKIINYKITHKEKYKKLHTKLGSFTFQQILTPFMKKNPNSPIVMETSLTLNHCSTIKDIK